MTRFTLTFPLQDTAGEFRGDFPRVAEQLIREHFEGFTRLHGVGVWNEYREPVGVWVIDSDADDACEKIRAIAAMLATYGEQEAVYVTAQPVTTFLVQPAPVAGGVQ